MPKIPFRFTPSSWGLRGRAYDLAEAYYSLEGEALSRKLIEIEHPEGSLTRARALVDLDEAFGHISPYEAAKARLALDGQAGDRRKELEIEARFGVIAPYEHDIEIAKLDYPEGIAQELALLEVDKAYDKIAGKAYEKKAATIRQEPWVGVVEDGFDMTQGINGVFFEFDWNDQWIEYLRMNGYGGTSEDEIVEQWFKDVCRATVLENAEPEDFDPFAVAERTSNRIDRGNGRADYL